MSSISLISNSNLSDSCVLWEPPLINDKTICLHCEQIGEKGRFITEVIKKNSLTIR